MQVRRKRKKQRVPSFFQVGGRSTSRGGAARLGLRLYWQGFEEGEREETTKRKIEEE
jgi:hypothetical protein